MSKIFALFSTRIARTDGYLAQMGSIGKIYQRSAPDRLFSVIFVGVAGGSGALPRENFEITRCPGAFLCKILTIMTIQSSALRSIIFTIQHFFVFVFTWVGRNLCEGVIFRKFYRALHGKTVGQSGPDTSYN